MVSTKYAPLHTPYIGKGRWTMHIPAIKNETLMDKIIDRRMKLQNALGNQGNGRTPTNPHAPQTLWTEFKKDIVNITKKHCAESKGKLMMKIKKIEKDLKQMSSIPDIDTNNNARLDEAYLAKELANLERIEARDKKDKLRAIITNHGKVLGGVWSGMNKERKPRDLLNRLRVPNSPTNNPAFERDSRRMAKLVRDYHESLQHKDIASQEGSQQWEEDTGWKTSFYHEQNLSIFCNKRHFFSIIF